MTSKGLKINPRDKNLRVFRWAQERKSESEGGGGGMTNISLKFYIVYYTCSLERQNKYIKKNNNINKKIVQPEQDSHLHHFHKFINLWFANA